MREIINLRLLAVLVLFSITITLLQLSLPLYSMQVFSRVVPTGHLATLVALFLLLIGLNCFAFVIDAVRNIMMSRLALRYDRKFHPGIARLSLESSQPDEQPLTDLTIIRTFISGPIAVAVLDAPWSIVFIFAMFGLHKTLGLVTLAIFAVVISWSCSGYYLTRFLRRRALDNRALEQSLLASAHVDQQVITAMGLRAVYLRGMKFAHSSAVFYLERLETRMAWLDSGTRLLRNVFQVVILTIAAVLSVDREVEVGAIVASTMLFSRALAPVERLSSGFAQLVEAHSALSRLKQAAIKFGEARAPLSLPPLTGRVTLVGVGVKVAGRPEPLLANINLDVEPGSIVLVVGAEGAGKSSLARVFCGATTPSWGEVRLDGFQLNNYDPDQLGQQIGYLPEAVRLESGSVASIIARGGPINMEAVLAASASAGAHSMIQRLPAGYDTITRPNDTSISAGQRQRIALARALYQRPKLIVLDEPTAHLDDEGEVIVAKAIKNLKEDGTTMFIVSRLPNLMHLADRLIYLQDGQVRMDIKGEAVRDQFKLRVAATRTGS